MKKSVFISVTVALALVVYGTALSAAEYGTAEEAKAMLERAVAEVKADADAALAKFNSGEGGFKDRDLYVFCFDAEDGKITAHPTLIGQDVRSIKDKTGKAFGEEMFTSAREGEMIEVSYMWPRPDSTEPAQKQSYVARIGEQICGVGYYD